MWGLKSSYNNVRAFFIETIAKIPAPEQALGRGNNKETTANLAPFPWVLKGTIKIIIPTDEVKFFLDQKKLYDILIFRCTLERGVFLFS